MFEQAAKGLEYAEDFELFENINSNAYGNVNLSEEFKDW